MLLENRFAKDAPLAPAVRRPASDPEYYDRLLRELAEAPNRGWFSNLVKRVKGSVRMA